MEEISKTLTYIQEKVSSEALLERAKKLQELLEGFLVSAEKNKRQEEALDHHIEEDKKLQEAFLL